MAVQMYRFCNMNSGHCQLGRSLERILEEANLSGELKLSNRKLKDFPKSATKYDLSDTVFADLSRNRFSELPEEITSFAFLETLILYHNTIRQISDAVKGLSSLTYLDLRSNQLSSLPREICFLPIRVLLIANNRLIALPEELGRMDKLTELDASCNLLTNLPPRMGDLKNLKSLSLRNNQLVYLPREITTLSLISLNLSSNRISSLPLEIRLMTTLVDLNLENNPLTSPPAGLCVRGLVHVFKFLEMQATKDDNKSKCSGLYDGYSTLRRTSRSANGTLENNSKTKKNIIDPVCLINDGLDKLLSQDSLNVSIRSNTTSLPKPSVFMNMQANGIHLSLKNQKTQQISINDIASNHNKYSAASVDQQHLHQQQQQQNVHNNSETSNINNVNNSTVIYDEAFVMDSNKLEDKNKNFGNIQTYKEYKEALKQQRNQEIANLYKIKGHKNLIDDSDNNITTLNCNVTQINEQQQQLLTPPEKCDKIITPPEIKLSGIKNGPTTATAYFDEIQITNKKPVQKVIPSRNISSSTLLSTSSSITTFSSSVTSTTSSTTITSSSYSSNINDNHNNLEIYKTNDDDQSNTTDMNDCYKYSKPKSPTKCNGVMVSTTINNTNNTIIMNNSNGGNNSIINSNLNANITKTGNNVKVQPFKSHYRNMNWDRDIPTGKLSFTMRREFDKQKEETELIAQLRSIIETRLKMNVPEDIASALTDGVILCHLANHVRPRSVASIHVPSPGVPKLTMARCRRNVDNFLEACRRIGIDEELICSCEDVVSSEETIDYNNDVDVINKLPNPSAVFKTISALINIIEDNKQHQQQHQQKVNKQLTPATNHHYYHNTHNHNNHLNHHHYQHQHHNTNDPQLMAATITTTTAVTSTATTRKTITTTLMMNETNVDDHVKNGYDNDAAIEYVNNADANGDVDNDADNDNDGDNDDDDTYAASTPTLCENDDEENDLIYNENDNENNLKNDKDKLIMHTCIINVPRSPSIKKLIKNDIIDKDTIILNNFEDKIIDNDIDIDYTKMNENDGKSLFNSSGNYSKYGEILNVNNLNIETNMKKFNFISDDNSDKHKHHNHNHHHHNDNNDDVNKDDNLTKNNLNINREMNTPEKIVTKRIEFFEGSNSTNHNNKLSSSNCHLNDVTTNNECTGNGITNIILNKNYNNNIINGNNSNLSSSLSSSKSLKYYQNDKSSVIFSICKPHSKQQEQQQQQQQQQHNQHNMIEKNNKFLSSSKNDNMMIMKNNEQNSTIFTIFLSCIFLITFLLLIFFPISN